MTIGIGQMFSLLCQSGKRFTTAVLLNRLKEWFVCWCVAWVGLRTDAHHGRGRNREQ